MVITFVIGHLKELLKRSAKIDDYILSVRLDMHLRSFEKHWISITTCLDYEREWETFICTQNI